MVDQMIGHYRIIEEIGRGGMGIVYKALDTRLNRPVAIKSLHSGNAGDEVARKRFLREAMMVAQLDHPFVGKVYEILEHEDQIYIVLEFVRGRSLSSLIADSEQVLPLDKVLELGREIAEALEEAHKNGIIHRDIKPNNIMLLESGHIKVLDFGIAKALRKSADSDTMASSSLTGTGQIMGTLSYMSPEQITGRDLDPRSDIFSFGIVLFEMIAGRRPFSGSTAAQVAASIMTEDSEPLHRYRKGIPDSLDRVIQRMLDKDPAERYQSVHEVWVELRHIREELATQTSRARVLSQAQVAGETPAEPVTVVDQVRPPSALSAQPGATPAPVGRWWPRAKSRQWVLGFMSALGMVAVVLFVLWYQSNQPALSFAARDWILIADFENLTGDSIFDRSLGTALNVSMSQSTHANVFSKARTSAVLQRMGRKPDTPIDEQVGREICQRENIRGLVCPSIGKVGNKFVISARIVDPQTGDGVSAYDEQASDYDQVLAALDGVAASLRRGLGESMAQVRTRSMPLAKVTTSSLTALKSYSEALPLWSKGQYRAALDLVLSAIKEDPDFAMAHAALGVYYSSHIFNEHTKAKEHYEKSLSLADRTTEREKMTIRLLYVTRFGTPETARTLYENYLRSYPDDVGQRYNFAGMLRDHNALDDAVEQYKEVIRLAPDYAFAHINLATSYSEQGKTREALASYDRAFQLEPTWITSGNLNHEYGFTLVSAGEYEKARKVFEQALSTSIKPMALRSLALLDLYQGKYRDAKARLNEALLLNVSSKVPLNESRNHLFMSMLLEGEGDSSGVQRELDKAAKCLETLSPQTWLDSRIGIGYSRGRSVDKAARILEKLRKEVNLNDAQQNSDLHRLEGEIEMARGNQARGLELLMLADRDKHWPLTIESLARAQQIAGKVDDAIASYEEFLEMRGQSDGWEPQQYWLAAHLHLAKLYVGRKEEEKARRAVQELLTLWKSADPDLPLNNEALRLNKSLSNPDDRVRE